MTGIASAPASSGNLGPGFDVIALALEVRCTCEAAPGDRWVVEEQGRAYEPSSDDLVVRAVNAVVGDRPMRLRIDNRIPRSRGLGSSSAVATAAAAAAARAVGLEPHDRLLFDVVTDLEGHPDNAAAAVYGGLVAACDSVVVPMALAPGLRVIVGIPAHKLSTRRARAALPAAVLHETAARSVARVAMLIEGLRTGDPEALAVAGGDELHELPRRDLSPITAELIEAARSAGALHAAWSGAGPSVIAFVTDDTAEDVERAMGKVLDGSGDVTAVDVAVKGWL